MEATSEGGSEQEPAADLQSAKGAFVEATKIVTNQDTELTEVICSDGCDVLRSLLPQMSAALLNLFAGNLVRGEQRYPWKEEVRHTAPGATRSRSVKRRKLSEVK